MASGGNRGGEGAEVAGKGRRAAGALEEGQREGGAALPAVKRGGVECAKGDPEGALEEAEDEARLLGARADAPEPITQDGGAEARVAEVPECAI